MTTHLLRRLGAVTVAVLVAALGIAAPAHAETTTGTISGHITRPDGSPAANESVFAEDVNFENPGGSAVTDENGFYSISDLAPGGYRLKIPRGGGSLIQYAFGQTSLVGAATFGVFAGEVTTVDEQLLGIGTIEIAVTEPDGTPARGEVSVYHLSDLLLTSGRLDETGRASMEALAGDYKVQVVPAVPGDPDSLDYARAQWLHGARSFEEGDVITVTADTATAVAERLLPWGSLTVTARDSIDGSPIADFCVSVAGREACSGGSGAVTVTALVPGTHEVIVFTRDDRYFSAGTTVAIVAGETVPVVVDLERAGRVMATVVDAATSQPVAGACLATSPAGTGRLPDGAPWCTDAAGRVTIAPVSAGAYNLFVRPQAGSGYGAQWVGTAGGTGDSAQARQVTVDPAVDAVVPPIKLDRAGTIAGVVTSAATEQPVNSGFVSLSAWGRIGPSFGTDIDESGRYTLDWLGPYEWPLLFTTDDHARQWSGGVADRREAKRIKVHAGKTVTYNPALKVGTVWTGTVTDTAGNPLATSLDAFNAATGDPMDEADTDGRGTYHSLILGPQTIKIQWVVFDETTTRTGWYDDDADFEHAKPVDVPKKGTLTVNMVIPTG